MASRKVLQGAARARTIDPVLARLSSGIALRVGDRAVPEIAGDVVERVTADVRSALHAEMVELARMLRQQGDAADEVAETLGRTLARLSAEVDHLAAAVADLTAEPPAAGHVAGAGGLRPPAPSGG